MTEINCCYNCKHCTQGWLIQEGSSQQTMICDVNNELVKPNNKCEKWGRAEK